MPLEPSGTQRHFRYIPTSVSKMNDTSSPSANGALSHAELRAPSPTPQPEITPEWMDDMTRRLSRETKRQIAQLENAAPVIGATREDAAVRAANVRTLDSLQRTLERLNRMEAERAARRAQKGNVNPQEARARIRARIIEIVEQYDRGSRADGDR